MATATATKRTASTKQVTPRPKSATPGAKKSTAKKVAATKAPAAKATPVRKAATASDDRIERLQLAKEEGKAVRAWKAAGSKGKRPATPNTEALEAKAPVRSSGSKPAPKPRIDFYKNGILVTSPQNVIYHGTRGLKSKDSVRCTSSEFYAILESKRFGIADPKHSEWEISLPSGVVLSTKFRKA